MGDTNACGEEERGCIHCTEFYMSKGWPRNMNPTNLSIGCTKEICLVFFFFFICLQMKETYG